MTNFEGVFESSDSPKRREEVLLRLKAGIPENKIAVDLGIAKHSLTEIIRKLHEDGSLPAGSAPPAPR